MLASIGAWAGWSSIKAAARWLVPLIIALALAFGIWILVVAPRIDLWKAEAKAQAEQLQRTEDALKRVEAQAAAQREVDEEKAAAVDEADRARSARNASTIIIREAAQVRAKASGDPEVSEALDAFFADLRREQGQ